MRLKNFQTNSMLISESQKNAVRNQNGAQIVPAVYDPFPYVNALWYWKRDADSRLGWKVQYRCQYGTWTECYFQCALWPEQGYNLLVKKLRKIDPGKEMFVTHGSSYKMSVAPLGQNSNVWRGTLKWISSKSITKLIFNRGSTKAYSSQVFLKHLRVQTSFAKQSPLRVIDPPQYTPRTHSSKLSL